MKIACQSYYIQYNVIIGKIIILTPRKSDSHWQQRMLGMDLYFLMSRYYSITLWRLNDSPGAIFFTFSWGSH